MIKKLFYIFIFFAPFTSFFALSAWLRLPIVINILLLITTSLFLLTKNKISLNFFKKEDLYLVVVLGMVWISFIFGFLEKRSFNHSLAYSYAILLYFFFNKFIINYFKINSLKISKIMYYSFVFMSLIVIIDFIGINFFNIGLRHIYTTVDGKISNMDYFIRSGFLRVGGVAEEPGHMAHFYNIYFGVSLFYIYRKYNKISFKIITLFLISHFCIFSNAGIALILIGFSIVFGLEKLQKLSISKNQLFWGSIGTLVIIIALSIIYILDIGGGQKIITEFSNKIFFNESHKSYSSSGQRLYQWTRAFKNFIKHPILGNGPGYGVHQDSEGYLSVYLTILSDIGLVAFIFFIGFLQDIIKKAYSLPLHIRKFILFSIITSVLHLIIIAEFYHAPFWILCVFIQLLYQEEKIKAE